MQIGQGISQVLRGSGESPKAIPVRGGGQMGRQIRAGQLVGYQKESASQWAFGDASGVANPDDPSVVELAQTTKLIEQAGDGRCFQSSGEKFHRACGMVREVFGRVDLATGSGPESFSKAIAIRDERPWAIAGPSRSANLIDRYHNRSLYDF
jgi:hypothetical protein